MCTVKNEKQTYHAEALRRRGIVAASKDSSHTQYHIKGFFTVRLITYDVFVQHSLSSRGWNNEGVVQIEAGCGPDRSRPASQRGACHHTSLSSWSPPPSSGTPSCRSFYPPIGRQRKNQVRLAWTFVVR